MNSSNDPLDKLLQQRFQQLFADEQAVVDASLKQKILNRLPPTAPHRHRLVSLLWLGVLVWVGAGFYYGVSSFNRMPNQADSRGLHLAARPVARRHLAGRGLAGRHSVDVGSTSQALVEPFTAGNTSMGGPVNTHPVTVTASANPTISRSLGKGFDKSSASPIEEVPRRYRSPKAIDYPLVHRFTTSQLAESPTQKSRFRRLWPPSSSHLPSASEELVLPPTTGSMNDSSTTEPATTLAIASLNWRPLRGLPGNPLSALLTRRVDFLATASASGQPALARSATTADWFFTASPLITYQRMTIVAKTDAYVRDVSSPAPWSSQTWGYQINGGVRWRGWDAAVSYGQLRRWAYYELATDDYQVEPTGTAGYQVTRRIETRSENVVLPMLGVGISRQYTVGKRQRHYARLGGQFTYVLPTQQALGWAQAGLGLNLPLGKAHQLQVGPTIDYSLNRIWNTERQLIIYPYTIGVLVSLRPQSILTR